MDYAQAKDPAPCFIVASVYDKTVKIDSKIDEMTTKTLTNEETALKLTSQANQVSKQNSILDTVNVADETDFDQLEKELNSLKVVAENLILKGIKYPNPDEDPSIDVSKDALLAQAVKMHTAILAYLDEIPE